MVPTPVIAAVVGPFVAWRVYMRVRRLMVRQRSHAWRHWAAAIVFPAVIVLMAAMARFDPYAIAALAAGSAAGGVLAFVALRKTVYEREGGLLYFTPHSGIGLAVSMLFIGRLLYRGYEMYMHGAAQAPDMTRSPLTLAVFGIMAGYYTVYASGLLHWRKQALAITN